MCEKIFISSSPNAKLSVKLFVVIARPERGQMSDPRGLAESLVLSSGRPVILFPPSGAPSRIRLILVGWNATREAVRAVVDALPLLARAEAVEVLIVDHERQRERNGQDPGENVPFYFSLYVVSHGSSPIVWHVHYRLLFRAHRQAERKA